MQLHFQELPIGLNPEGMFNKLNAQHNIVCKADAARYKPLILIKIIDKNAKKNKN